METSDRSLLMADSLGSSGFTGFAGSCAFGFWVAPSFLKLLPVNFSVRTGLLNARSLLPFATSFAADGDADDCGNRDAI